MTVVDPPTFPSDAASTVVRYEGGEVVLQVAVAGDEPLTYQWQVRWEHACLQAGLAHEGTMSAARWAAHRKRYQSAAVADQAVRR